MNENIDGFSLIWSSSRMEKQRAKSVILWVNMRKYLHTYTYKSMRGRSDEFLNEILFFVGVKKVLV